MKELIIGLGSNLGDRHKNIETAIGLIAVKIGPVGAASTLVETEPWGFASENKFLNGAIVVDPQFIPETTATDELLAIIKILQVIEKGFGRVRTGVYMDRAIDLDILFYGEAIVNIPELIVPHPKLHLRDFILVSLMELCPDKIHPVIGKSIREIWGRSVEKGDLGFSEGED